MKHFRILTLFFAAAGILSGGLAYRAQGAVTYTEPQIEQMVAPIALYPDALMSQVLMAATYPDQVAEADQWMRENPGLSGPALDDALSTSTWDPSVISMCKFPTLLDRMGRNMQWTTDLGYAFLYQRNQVMDAVQRLRRDSYRAGYLRSGRQQTVVVQPSYIAIQPYNPSVVYVPAYNPAVVFGAAWGSYPTYYYSSAWRPSPGASLVNGFAWGVGFIVAHALFGDCDWHHHDVYMNRTVIVHNRIFRNTYVYRDRDHGHYRGHRHVWTHHIRRDRRHEGFRGAPYGGRPHGRIRGIEHLRRVRAYHPRKARGVPRSVMEREIRHERNHSARVDRRRNEGPRERRSGLSGRENRPDHGHRSYGNHARYEHTPPRPLQVSPRTRNSHGPRNASPNGGTRREPRMKRGEPHRSPSPRGVLHTYPNNRMHREHRATSRAPRREAHQKHIREPKGKARAREAKKEKKHHHN
jgi:hypothetical protein